MRIAVTREVSSSLARCELSYVDRSPIDVDLARQQHAAYCAALVELGCEVRSLPALESHPDAVFVEDVVLVFDKVAVMTRPGAASRRGEGASVAAVLGDYRTLLHIAEPGTIDGGDVLRIGREVLIGLSGRSNSAAFEQLQAILGEYGYRVRGVAISGCLHLKSAVTEIADGVVLINPQWIDPAQLPGLTIIEVDPSEAHGANALRIDANVIYPSCFPLTQARIEAAGIKVVSVDVSELQKAEGAVTCCSLLFHAASSKR